MPIYTLRLTELEMDFVRRRQLPNSPKDFEALAEANGILNGKLGDIRRLDRRHHADRRMTEDFKPREKDLSLSGSSAKFDDALYLRPIFSSDETNHFRDLVNSEFLSEESFQTACSELGLSANLNTGEFSLVFPHGFDPDVQKPTKGRILPDSEVYDHDPSHGAPRKKTIQQVVEPYRERRDISFYRDLDNFIEVLGIDCKQGSGRMFRRKDPGVFYPAAKIYESYKPLPNKTPDRAVAMYGPEASPLFDQDNESPSQRVNHAGSLPGVINDGFEPDEEDTDTGGTRTGRPDEERVTNFVTPWWNALSTYQKSTRASCTMIPDRAGYTLVVKKDATEADEPPPRKQSKKTLEKAPSSFTKPKKIPEHFKLFAAHVDGVVPKQDRPEGPTTSKLRPDMVLLTAEYKPPHANDGHNPFKHILPQVTFEIVGRIAAQHNPWIRGSEWNDFTGRKFILVAVVCGFQFVLIQAHYEAPYVQYLQRSDSKVWQAGMTAKDFLWMRVVAKVDMLHESKKVYLLNALLLGIFLEEYDTDDSDDDTEDGYDSDRPAPIPFNPITPIDKGKQRVYDSVDTVKAAGVTHGIDLGNLDRQVGKLTLSDGSLVKSKDTHKSSSSRAGDKVQASGSRSTRSTAKEQEDRKHKDSKHKEDKHKKDKKR